MTIVLRDEAQAEFDEEFDFLEGRRSGSGVAFATRAQTEFDRIAANPEMHAVVFAEVRKAVVPRSPYCIFYRVEATRVQVLSVFHTARDPSVWRGRA